MGRNDWYYASIPIDMAESLDYIINRNGRKYGVTDRLELIRAVLAEFIANYEKSNNLIIALRDINNNNNDKGNGDKSTPTPALLA